MLLYQPTPYTRFNKAVWIREDMSEERRKSLEGDLYDITLPHFTEHGRADWLAANERVRAAFASGELIRGAPYEAGTGRVFVVAM